MDSAVNSGSLALSIFRTYETSPERAFNAVISAAGELGLDVSMVDPKRRSLLVARRLTLSATDNARGGVTVCVSWDRPGSRGDAKTARRLLRVVERRLQNSEGDD